MVAVRRDDAVAVRLLRGNDVDALATIDLALAAAQQSAALVARGTVTSGRVQIGNATAWMRILAGFLPDLDVIGFKQFHRVGRRVRYHIFLFRHSTGDPLAIVDGRRITSLRTAATAAVAFRHYFRSRPFSLAIIGSGEEAREGLRALVGATALQAARVFSPTRENRTRFARELSDELALPITSSGSIDEALDGVDAVYVATAASSPFLQARAVSHVAFVAAIGSTRPDQRELYGDVLSAADTVVVDCADALHEPGDVIEAVEARGWDPSTALLLGKYLERPSASCTGQVIFKSIGSVEQDLVLAHHLFRAGKACGRGDVTDTVASLRMMR